jgi:TRAP-type C4-dicarboxylate transport system permease small subunit
MVRHLDRSEEYLAVALIVVLGALLTAQVAMRFLLGLGYAWIEEISRVLFVWVIFLGAIVGMRRYAHVRVTAGLLLFSKYLRPFVEMLGDLVLLLFCLALAWHGWELVYSTVEVDFRLQATGISMFGPYLIMPVSFGLQALRLVIRYLRGRPEPAHD